MALSHTSVNVITGAIGSGKTRLIGALLEQRPEGEHWAVLTNDFGTSTPANLFCPTPEVDVREVAGCVCCSGQLVLRTALISLVREKRPRRVLIEASAAAEPGALFELLASPNLASALDVNSFIATVSVTQLTDPRYAGLRLYREQLGSADVIVLTAAPGTPTKARDAAHAALGDIIAVCARVVDDMRRVGLELLDLPHRSRITPG